MGCVASGDFLIVSTVSDIRGMRSVEFGMRNWGRGRLTGNDLRSFGALHGASSYFEILPDATGCGGFGEWIWMRFRRNWNLWGEGV